MRSRGNRWSLVVGLAGLIALSGGLVACGNGDPASDGATSTTTTSSTSTTSIATSSTTSPDASTSVSAYFVRDEKVAPARRAGSASSPARSAVEALLAGPDPTPGKNEGSTAIPTGTTLRSIDIANGLATVDLSREFGSGGGSLSMQERVAQVVYTVTQFPTATQVTFRIDGAPITTLGGEGLVLDHPQTRADWESMTPAILLESPLAGDALTSPFDITGTADTFEATFQVALTDSRGATAYQHFVTATSGSGTRGTFRHTVTFTGAAAGPATLTVYEPSAKDGTPVNVITIAVSL